MSNRELVAGLLPGRARLSGWAFVERAMESQIQSGVTTERHWRDHLEQAGLMPSWERYNAWKIEHPDDPAPAEVNAVVGVRDLKPVSYWEAQSAAPSEPRKDLA